MSRNVTAQAGGDSLGQEIGRRHLEIHMSDDPEAAVAEA
jgi:hypothetical protein